MSLQGAVRSLKKGFASIVPWVVNFQKKYSLKRQFLSFSFRLFSGGRVDKCHKLKLKNAADG